MTSMTEPTRRPNYELLFFALAFVLAIVVRLLRLGEVPLSDDEARWAVQALDLARNLHPVIDPQPAYVLLTALAFFVFQASNFTARLVPALFGSLLVLAPMLFRDRLGNKTALILSFVLVFEPGLLAISRLAGSPIMVVTSAVLAWGFWRSGKLPAAGIFAGLALLSGPLLLPGVVGLALVWGLVHVFPADEPESDGGGPVFDRQKLITTGAYALGTYLLVGSLFLLAPGGLSAGLAAIPAYFTGWGNPSDVPALRLTAALAFYELFAIVLAVAALVRGIRAGDRLVMGLGFWLLVTLILAISYPARQVADLAWLLLPLWTLAVIEVSHYIVPIEGNVWETLAMVGLTLGILFFAGTNFITIAISPSDMTAAGRQLGPWALTVGQVYWVVLIGALLLLAASVALVGYGWSRSVAFQGALGGVLIALVIINFSIAMAAANLRTYRTSELWASGPRTMQADTLVGQLNDLSRWSKGANGALDISVSGLDSPAMRWLLRDWKNVTYSSEPTLTGAPAFVIGAGDQTSAPQLTSAYRGQEFTWRDYPAWDSLQPSDWLSWSILHQAPAGEQKIILWTRGDIFVDAQNASNP
jgi:hypothetical protein